MSVTCHSASERPVTAVSRGEKRRQIADDLDDAWSRAATRFGITSTRFFCRVTSRATMSVAGRPGASDDPRQLSRAAEVVGIPTEDYKRFHNFLMANRLQGGLPLLRQGTPEHRAEPQALLRPSQRGRRGNQRAQGTGARSGEPSQAAPRRPEPPRTSPRRQSKLGICEDDVV